MNKKYLILLLVLSIFPTIYSNTIDDSTEFVYNSFAIIIPTYNAIEWYKKCLDSVVFQDYPEDKVQVFVIDDCSTDGQAEAIEQYIKDHDTKNWITLIKNEQKWWAAGNRWKAAHWCDPETVIIDLDGDDWFSHPHVLTRVNEEYNKGDVLVTWGQWQSYPKNKVGTCRFIPNDILKEQKLRSYHATDLESYEFATGHLRSYKAWLFQQIKLKDFLYKGEIYTAGCDVQIMLSLVEMAQERSRFIPDVLYIYNCINPISDWRTKLAAQRDINEHIRNQPPYPRVEKNLQISEGKASMIIFAESPRTLQTYLTSVHKYAKNISDITVMISSDFKDHPEYKKVQATFPSNTYFEYQKNNMAAVMHNVVKLAHDFIVLATDQAPLAANVDIASAARALGKTHAHAFYAPTIMLRRFFVYTKCLVPIDVGDMAAWQYCYAKDRTREQLALASTLYAKKTIMDCLEAHEICSVKDCAQVLAKSAQDDDLGLVFQVFVKGLVPEPQVATSSYLALNWLSVILLMVFFIGIGIVVVRPNLTGLS